MRWRARDCCDRSMEGQSRFLMKLERRPKQRAGHIIAGNGIEEPEPGKLQSCDIAGMGLTAHDVGTTHEDFHARIMGGTCRFDCGRKLGDADTVSNRLPDMG